MDQQYNVIQVPFTLILPYYTDPTTHLYVTGNCQELGNWDYKGARQLKMIQSGLWQVVVKVKEFEGQLEWKYIELFKTLKEVAVKWQEGQNQIYSQEHLKQFKMVQAQNGNNIKIMSFNIRYQNDMDGINHWNNRKEAVVQIIKESEADFIGLQEVVQNQRNDIVHQVNGIYNYIGRSRDYNPNEGEASPILYKKAVWTSLFDRTFWLSANSQPGSLCFSSNLPRIVTLSLFQNNFVEDLQILVVNTHFDLDIACQQQSLPVLFHELQKEFNKHKFKQIVFMGDFNSDRGNMIIKHIIENNIFKFIQLSPKKISTFHDFLGDQWQKEEEIDHIFYSGNQYHLQEYKRITESPPCIKSKKIYPSDHYPIVCVLEKN